MARRTPVQTLDTARGRLIRLHATTKSWRKVAALVGVPAGTACSIAKGREPHKASHRLALGLPLLIPVPACHKCGAVHTTKRCTALGANGHSPRKRVNWKRLALMLMAAWMARE